MAELKISLNLDSKNSELDGLTLFEPIDVSILDKLINSDLLLNTFNNPMSEYNHSNEREQLILYKKLIDDKGLAKIEYNKVKNINYGRVNPNKALGLFSIRRQIRQTLAKGKLTDIDIENCHPVILLQICNSNSIACKYLEEYTKKRNEHLQKVMTDYKVSRDVAKKLFIQLLYFGSFETWKRNNNVEGEETKFINNFKNEIQKIGETISNNNKQIIELVKKRKEEQIKKNYNLIGSVVSYYLQEIECQILETIYNYCVNKKYITNNIAVLCADGLMIETANYKPELLKELHKLILNKFGLNLKFTEKEMTEDYLNILDEHQLKNELTEYFKEDFNIRTMTTLFNNDILEFKDCYLNIFEYSKSFKYFNYYSAQFYLTNSIYKIYKNKIEIFGKTFNETFNQLNFTPNGKIYKFTDLYDNSQQKTIYSSFDFEPNRKKESDKYNLFRGFIFDDENNEYDEEIIKPFLEHVKYICNNNESYEYVINWLSHIIQKPEEKTGVGLVFYSITEGVGKNIIFEIYEKIIEGYEMRFRDTKDLTSQFNGLSMGKLFCIGDEINGRAQEIANELKDMLTRNKQVIEFKGKDKFIVNDYNNYVFTTNNEDVFKISQSDRRFMFIECPEEIKNQEYYINLVNFKNNNKCLKHLYNYFKTKDLTTYNTREIVMTDYKLNLIVANLPAYIRFIKDEYENYEGENYDVNDLYKFSLDYARRNKLTSKYTEMLFSKKFKAIFGELNIKDKETRRSIYSFPKGGKNQIIDLINKSIGKN